MPASRLDLYHMQDARNNFDAMRPAPVCTDANQFMGQCHKNIHISTNCYYGYQDPKPMENCAYVAMDCESSEASQDMETASSSPQSNSRKRSADDSVYPHSKRLRDEIQRVKNNEPETSENMRLDTSAEDLLETLYWNIHGGNVFHLIQCQ